jgi:hypothetical protein
VEIPRWEGKKPRTAPSDRLSWEFCHGGNMVATCVAAGGSAVSISSSRGCKASSKGIGGRISPAATDARASLVSAPGSIAPLPPGCTAHARALLAVVARGAGGTLLTKTRRRNFLCLRASLFLFKWGVV